MPKVLEEAQKLDIKYPTIKPYQGKFTGYAKIDTSKLRIFKPNGFQTILDRICVANSPPTKQSKKQFELIDLMCESANLYDQNNRKIIVGARSDKKTRNIIKIPSINRAEFEDSLQVLLFNHNDKRIGVLADIIRYVGKNKLTKVYTKRKIKKPSSLSKMLANILFNLLREYKLYDLYGKPVEVKKIEFLGTDERYSLYKVKASGEWKHMILKLLGSIGEYVEEESGGYGVKLDTTGIFNSKVGKLQKILTPWTFGCNASCLFCYTDWELGTVMYPPGWNRPWKEIEFIAENYNPNTRLGPPQSIFPMADWEPMKHPQFLNIIQLMAKKAPNEAIFIVTNGEFMTEELAMELSKIPQIHLQISLNSADSCIRQRVMRSYRAEAGINSLMLCKKYQIPFDISIVATPQWTGWKDIYKTIKYVDDIGLCSYIRLALPTATKNHHPDLMLPDEELIEIKKFVEKTKKVTKVPIIITVALIGENSLKAKIEGIIKDSVAHNSGLKTGDIIRKIGSKVIRSRTEANDELEKINKLDKKIFNIAVDRENKKLVIKIKTTKGKNGIKGRGSKELGLFGILLPDDVDYTIFEKMKAVIKQSNFKKPIMLSSKIMEPFFVKSLKYLKNKEKINSLKIVPVENKYFGGNVNIAGLQVVDDQISALNNIILKNKNYKPDVAFVSAAAFSRAGDDLKGDSFKKLEKKFGLPVYIIKANTGSY